MEDEHHAGDGAGAVLDRGRAVFDGHLAPVTRHQRRVIGQGDDSPFAEHAGDDVLARRAGLFVDDAEHVLDGLAQGLASPPSQ